jgi:hypothetical protein
MSLLLIESLDLSPSNQYILVSESTSCLRLEKMCVRQVISGKIYLALLVKGVSKIETNYAHESCGTQF